MDWRRRMRRAILPLALLFSTGPATAQVSQNRVAEAEGILTQLVQSYGVSGMEGPVRSIIQQQLPRDLKPRTDTAGNLWVTVGTGEPTVVFIAHMDEIGFRVTEIRRDGTLALASVGGLFPRLWEGRPALVHTGRARVPGVFLPRDSAASLSPADTVLELRADVGTSTREATAALGIEVG